MPTKLTPPYARVWMRSPRLRFADPCHPRHRTAYASNRIAGTVVFAFFAIAMGLAFPVLASNPATGSPSPRLPLSPSPPLPFDCGLVLPEEGVAAVRAAVEAGEIPDPALRPPPRIKPRRAAPDPTRGTDEVTAADIFPYEDSDGLLLTDFSNGQLYRFMGRASNALLAYGGDNFDTIAFFLNFQPHHQIGNAFFLLLQNDVTGLNIPRFNSLHLYGVGGQQLHGWVMMWNQANWEPGDSEIGDFTQLILGHEFEHRFGIYLRPIAGGRRMQGDNGACGRGAHWNFKVDAQGSAIEIRDWIGASPAVLRADCISFSQDECFNADIGGVFSWPDLYLMGYASPEEMDTQASELRYMNESEFCSSPYSGPISTWNSADIINTNGVRVPDWTEAQKDFRAGWIMIHQPDAPPTEAELLRVAAMLNHFTQTWHFSTLGRGTLDNTIYRDCNSNGVRDIEDITAGTSPDCDGNYIPDECQPDCNSNGLMDACEIRDGYAPDCQPNGVPDECDVAPDGASVDCTANGTPDECETDCNTNGVRDDCDVTAGTSEDCNSDLVPDECGIDRQGTRYDCNLNRRPDGCDVADGFSADCNSNGVPDECDAEVCESLWNGFEPVPPFAAGSFIDGLDYISDGNAWDSPNQSATIGFQGCPGSTGKALKVVAQSPLVADVLASEYFTSEREPQGEFDAGAPIWSLSFDVRSEAFLNPRIDWQLSVRDGSTDRAAMLIHWASTQSNYPGVSTAQGGNGRGRILVKNPTGTPALLNTGFVITANTCVHLHITLNNITGAAELFINDAPRATISPLEPKAYRLDFFRLEQVPNGQASGGINRLALDNFQLCRRGAGLVPAGARDCDANGTLDECDLADGAAPDCNVDGRHDACDAPGDFDGDGAVDAADYAEFASCITPPCDGATCEPVLCTEPCCARADFDHDGDVDLSDFAALQILSDAG